MLLSHVTMLKAPTLLKDDFTNWFYWISFRCKASAVEDAIRQFIHGHIYNSNGTNRSCLLAYALGYQAISHRLIQSLSYETYYQDSHLMIYDMLAGLN